MREEGEAAAIEVGVPGIHPELLRLLGRMKFRTSYGQNALKHSIEVAQLSGLLAGEIGLDVRMAKRAGLLHDIGKSIDHDVEGSHIQIGVDHLQKVQRISDCDQCSRSTSWRCRASDFDRLCCTGCRYDLSSKTRCKKRDIRDIYKQIETIRRDCKPVQRC